MTNLPPAHQFLALDEGFQPVDVARQLLALPLLRRPAFDVGVQFAMLDGMGDGDFDVVHFGRADRQ